MARVLREGWEEKTLGNVCEMIKRGISPKYIENNGYIVLNQKCIRDHKINFEKSRLHDNLTKKVNPERIIKLGDVLINSTGTGTLGRVAQVKDNFKNVIVDSHVTIVRPLPNLFFINFFGWALIYIEEKITNSGEGCGGQTELTRDKLENDFKICFPNSKTEQQKIVAILDEAFSAIDKAKANAQLNLKNAKELFESYLQSVFENKDEDWEEKTLKEIGVTQTGNTPATKNKDNYGSYIPFVKPAHFNRDGSINPKSSGLSKKGLKSARLFKANSILMVCIGATIGKTGFSEIDVTSNQQINAFTPPEKFEAKLFYYLFITNNFQNKIIQNSAQATLPIINKSKWGNLSVSFPKSLQTQQTIVKKLDALSEQTKKLESIYEQKLQDLDELKKSILQKAFNGEL